MKDRYDVEYIQSRNNEKIKYFAKLSDPKFRESERLFLAEGIKLSDEAVTAGTARCLLIREDAAEREDVKRVLDKSVDNVLKYKISGPAFSKISTEMAPQGLIAVSAYPATHTEAEQTRPESLDAGILVALDGIRDPGNLGTILRSALAFGVDHVIIGDSADIYNPKTVRASMGAVFRIGVITCSDLAGYLSSLSGRGRRIIGAALSDSSEDFSQMELSPSDVPVIGNEGHGIGSSVLSVCTELAKIPMSRDSESLNAGVAASLIMWEYYKLRQRII